MRRLFCKVYLGFKKSRLFVYLKIFLFLDISYIQGAFFTVPPKKRLSIKKSKSTRTVPVTVPPRKFLVQEKNKVSEQRLRHMCNTQRSSVQRSLLKKTLTDTRGRDARIHMCRRVCSDTLFFSCT